MFKPLAALIAAATFAMPSLAKIDAGTPELIRTLEEYGVTMLYNPSECSQGHQGSYTTAKVLTLCYKGRPTAGDHDTVRHEAAHFLQHCAAIKRGDRGITPLAVNTTTRTQWISTVLSDGHIHSIKDTYPEHAHQVELEAFAMAHHYSASDITRLIKDWCVR